jgi:outer membrane protein assembly factor BamB
MSPTRAWNHKTAPGEPDDYLNRLEPPQRETLRILSERDDTPRIDPAFAQQLRSELFVLIAEREFQSPDPTLFSVVPPSSEQIAAARRPRRVFRIWPFLELAAAALIIFALAGVYFGTDTLLSAIPGREKKSVPNEETSNVRFFLGNAARTGEMPGAGPASQPSVIWTFVDENFSLFSAAAVVDGVAYVSNGDRVLALDASTGEKRWESPIKGIQNITQPAPAPAPAVIDGLVFVGSTDGTLHAIDATTGVERWTYAAGHSITGSPIVVDGVVYAATGQSQTLLDDMLFALDERTGERLWTFPIDGALNTSPAFADGLVYVVGGMASSAQPTVFAVDAMTGTQRWAFQPEGLNSATPSVANGKVYLGDSTGTFYALDAGTGDVLWKVTIEAVNFTPEQPATLNQGGYTPAAIANGTIYVAGHNGVLYAFNEENGDILWQVESAFGRSSPIIAGNVVYIGSEQNVLLALDGKDGHELWRYETDSPIHSSAAVSNGVVYFGDLSTFYALSDKVDSATATTSGG